MTFFIDEKTIEVDCNGIVTQVNNFKEDFIGIIKDTHKKSLFEISNEVQELVAQRCE